jgi:hypothetical protein
MSNKYEFIIKAKDATTAAFNSIDSKIGRIQTTSLAAAGAIAAMAGGITALSVVASKNARLLDNQARLANESVESFQAMAFAFDKFGISQEKYADISKDVSDKLGDFIATGAGPFKDFFEQIGNQVGVTANALKDLSGADALIAVKKAMDQANISMAEQSFYLESIGNDATLLIPALANGGKAVKDLAKEFNDLGLAISGDQIEALKEADLQYSLLSKRMEQINAVVATKLGPSLEGVMKTLSVSLPGAIETTINSFRVMAAGVLGLIDIIAIPGEKLAQLLSNLPGAAGEYYEKQVKVFADLRANLKGAIGEIFDDINGVGSSKPLEIDINPVIAGDSEELLFQGAVWDKFRANIKQQALDFDQVWVKSFDSFSGGIGKAVGASIMEAKSFSDGMKELTRGVIQEVISGLAAMGVKKLALFALEKTISTSGKALEVATAIPAAVAVASAWAPAAAMASLASFGANAVPAAAGITSTFALSEGLALAGIAHDGIDNVPREGTWLLDKGERVVDSRTNSDLKSYLTKKDGGAEQSGGNPMSFSFAPVINSRRPGDIIDELESIKKPFMRMIQSAINDPI